jgi:hypothetical protein
MDAVRSTWTDERLDDFRDRTEAHFDALERRFDSVDRRFDTIERRIDGLADRVDRLQHLMVQGFIAMMAAMFTGFAGLAALIVTQI